MCKKDKNLIVRIDEEMLEKLKKRAELLGISVSDLVRMTLKNDMRMKGY